MCTQALLEQQDTDGAVQAAQHGGVALEWQRVAELLGRKYDRIDAVQALPLLPLQVNLQGYRHHCTPLPLPPSLESEGLMSADALEAAGALFGRLCEAGGGAGAQCSCGAKPATV